VNYQPNDILGDVVASERANKLAKLFADPMHALHAPSASPVCADASSRRRRKVAATAVPSMHDVVPAPHHAGIDGLPYQLVQGNVMGGPQLVQLVPGNPHEVIATGTAKPADFDSNKPFKQFKKAQDSLQHGGSLPEEGSHPDAKPPDSADDETVAAGAVATGAVILNFEHEYEQSVIPLRRS
jgi:hypothetical protein